ncbi:DUF485 domain-containing protein [Microbacteriaceae bacterium 4G12]
MEVKQQANARAEKNEIDYTKIVHSDEFKQLLRVKKNFIVPLSIFFFCFFIALPIMTSYSKVLNTPAFGAITWAWIFAIAQFIMTWSLCMIYTKKAESFDRLSNRILQKMKG